MSNFSIVTKTPSRAFKIFLGCLFFCRKWKDDLMFLTKRYFKKFQYGLLGACIFAAAFIGSIQTGFIIRAVGKAKVKGRKQANEKKG
jgi:hypothetical protein